MSSLAGSDTFKKLLEGAVTAVLIATFLYSDRSPLQIWRTRGHRIDEVPIASPEVTVQRARHEAFFSAQQDILSSFPTDTLLGWCSETNATFTRTPKVDFIALQADHQSERGKRVNQHWIVRLDSSTKRVIGKLTWEE